MRALVTENILWKFVRICVLRYFMYFVRMLVIEMLNVICEKKIGFTVMLMRYLSYLCSFNSAFCYSKTCLKQPLKK